MNFNFIQVLSKISSIQGCLCVGLQALRNDSKYITPKDTNSINGSVNLDSCLKGVYPNANRWDYLVSYKKDFYYIEIHPAKDSEVQTLIQKHIWLKNWIQENKLENYHSRYYWIPSGRNSILPSSIYGKKNAQRGINLTRNLKLD
jgi:hypothetical protein